jgi:hypothetical protein
MHLLHNSYLRSECEKTFFTWGTSDNGASALFARMCRIRQYFLKRTLCLIYRIPFVNRMAVVHALAKMSIELIAIIFSLSKFSSSKLEKWRFVNQILLHRYYQVKLFSKCSKRRILFGWFWSTSARNRRSCTSASKPSKKHSH